MKNLRVNILSFIDRNWCLIFKRKKCVKLKFVGGEPFKYNEIMFDGDKWFICLGNNWFMEYELKQR